ncbi:MAG: magnesium transporter [Peptoniphilus sp.]|nr:magnesium transporter [Peptoniphilus sp.]
MDTTKNYYETDLETRISKIREIIDSSDKEVASQLCEGMHYVDIVEALDNFEDDEINTFINLLSFENIAGILENSWEEMQMLISSFFTRDQLISIFSYMNNADIADLLGVMPTYRRKDILKFMKESESNILNLILSFDEESAGGIMTTEYIALKEHLTVENALAKIKDIAPETEIIEYLFITDNHHRLKGIVDLRKLLVAPEDTTLAMLYKEFPFFVYATDDQEKASILITKYDLDILPVVNKNMAILGIITSDEIMHVIDQEYSEDILVMSGVNKYEEYDSNFFESFKNRIPWLSINMITAFIASSVVGLFSSTIETVVALSAAMPIVAGMGGNAGNQTLSIVLTSLARGEINLRNNWKLVFKEVGMGILNGAIVGTITGFILSIKYQNPFLMAIMAASMVLNMIVAGVAGFLIPLVLDHIHVDPAVSSSIMLTAFTDTCGFFIFLGLSTVFLSNLI